MAGKDIPAAGQVLTANGGSGGIITVTSTAGFQVGSRCNISSTAVAGVEVIVTEITDSTHLKARLTRPKGTVKSPISSSMPYRMLWAMTSRRT